MTLDDPTLDPSTVVVEVTNPETDFGGVQVIRATDDPILVSFDSGNPVMSVFGRIGNVLPLCTDYDECYAPLNGAFESPLNFLDSLHRVGNNVNLDGDNNTPGNDKVYGTDGAGVKGWRAFPAAGGPFENPLTFL